MGLKLKMAETWFARNGHPARPANGRANGLTAGDFLSACPAICLVMFSAILGPSPGGLSGPILRDIAIVSLRYPLSRDTFLAMPAIPQQGAIPPLGAFLYTDISLRYPILQRIARYLCETPGKQARKSFAMLSLKASRDMKSIAAGPLSRWGSPAVSPAIFRPSSLSSPFPTCSWSMRSQVAISA